MSLRLPPVVCFSHLRWDFVYQRPQHIMSRLAATRTVIFYEESTAAHAEPRVDIFENDGVTIVKPYIPQSLQDAERIAMRRQRARPGPNSSFCQAK